MNRVILSSLMAIAVLATSGLAQLPARKFLIGDVAIAPNQVLDARAVPGLDGAVSVLITAELGIVDAIEKAIGRNAGKPLAVVLDGKLIGEIAVLPSRTEPIEVPVSASLSEAEGAAIHISGKPPLPDSLEEEE